VGATCHRPRRIPQKCVVWRFGSAPYFNMGRWAFERENGVKLKAKAAIFTLLMVAAGCTDLKPLEARIEDLQSQVDKLQADLAKSSSNAATANKAAAASASAAASDAKQALSIAEANTAAIDKLNAKIDQMFKRRPTE
jgi:type II secretory pathway component PulM